MWTLCNIFEKKKKKKEEMSLGNAWKLLLSFQSPQRDPSFKLNLIQQEQELRSKCKSSNHILELEKVVVGTYAFHDLVHRGKWLLDTPTETGLEKEMNSEWRYCTMWRGNSLCSFLQGSTVDCVVLLFQHESDSLAIFLRT